MQDTALLEHGGGAAWHGMVGEGHGHGMLCVN